MGSTTCPYCMQRADRCACEDPRIVGYENATPTPPAPADDASGAEAMRPEVVCLCGSTRFIDTFQEQYGRLTDEGKIVLTVGRVVPQSEQALGSQRKVALDTLHLRKIDLADRVLVLNVGGYVGPSTRREIAYAKANGKPIDLLHPDAGLDGPPPAPLPARREEAVVEARDAERFRWLMSRNFGFAFDAEKCGISTGRWGKWPEEPDAQRAMIDRAIAYYERALRGANGGE